MAATSMAAALAASLPAPQAAPAPSAPTYEAIPASMAQVIDIEAEIHITSVQLDAIVSTSRPFYELDTAAVPSAPGVRKLPPAGVPGSRAHAGARSTSTATRARALRSLCPSFGVGLTTWTRGLWTFC